MTAPSLSLLRLAWATTAEQAVLIARTALDDGADKGDVIDALIEWWETRDGDVQTIRTGVDL